MRRFDPRSRPSADCINLTLDAINQLGKFVCGWQYPIGSIDTLCYHSVVSSVGVTGDQYICDGSVWKLPDPPPKPEIFVIENRAIAYAYAHAAGARDQTDPVLLADLKGGDMLAFDAGLPYNAMPYTWLYGQPAVGWVYGDRHPNAGNLNFITTDPDNWTYPGGRCGTQPFTENPLVNTGGPGWTFTLPSNWQYWWYPAYRPEPVSANYVLCGSSEPIPQNDFGTSFEHTVHCKVDVLGYPTFLAFCPDGTVINSAKLEITASNLERRHTVYSRTNSVDPAQYTVNTSLEGMQWVLVGQKLVATRCPRWEPLGFSLPVSGAQTGRQVVDISAICQMMLLLRDSEYYAFGFIPSFVADFATDASLGSRLAGQVPRPSVAYDSVNKAWYTSDWQQVSYQWGGITTGKLWLDVTYPSGLNDFLVFGENPWSWLPPMTDRA